MLHTIIEWFKNLDDADKIAIVVPVGLAAIGGLFILFKWLFRKDPDLALEIIDDTLKENKQLRQTVKKLEEQLAKSNIETSVASEQSIPVPSEEAKELAKMITHDDGPYAQALKAIAEGNTEKADELLDETQKFLDHTQQAKDKAQAKIYFARMQNALYDGKYHDSCEWADKLDPLAGNDAQILNFMGGVYYENAMYDKAEVLMKRSLAIDEAGFGKDHPNVATDLNNLAMLYQNTNRMAEVEPLMKRAMAIWEKSIGENHPRVTTALNNLAHLYKATNRLAEAEPLMKRALAIDEASFGKDHPKVAIRLNNMASLYKATNRLAEAESMYKRSLAIDEASFGKDHPNVAKRLNNLATLYYDMNRLMEAEPMFKRAVEIAEKSLGPNHPNTIRFRQNWDICRGKPGTATVI